MKTTEVVAEPKEQQYRFRVKHPFTNHCPHDGIKLSDDYAVGQSKDVALENLIKRLPLCNQVFSDGCDTKLTAD